MDITEWVAEDFLDIVWGNRPGWVDLPAKVGQYWVPYHVRWPMDPSRRIDICIRDQESLYFSAGMFTRKGRRYEDMKSSEWLWADLDEVHPEVVPLPTVAWESSPDRYQAMWKLEKRLVPEKWERINQALSYHLGADTGGWDRTQVLRLPGTYNWKYPGGPSVKLMWYLEDVSYTAAEMWHIVKGSAPVRGTLTGGVVPRKEMPGRARALLRVPSDAVVEGERSSRLWELECLLAEAGWGEDDIYAVVVASAWNKWAGLGTEEVSLRRDISRAIRHVLSKTSPPREAEGTKLEGPTDEPERLPWVSYSTFLQTRIPEPKWLIEDIWTAESHGIIGGEPKSSKTGFALAMALAVASGRKFLNRFPVHTPGPVLFIQEENAQWMMQDRLMKLANYYGLLGNALEVRESEAGALGDWTVEIEFPHDLDLYILNNFSMNLTDEEHQDKLETMIAEKRPALVVLDPLYLLFGGVNTDRAEFLYPYLKWLLYLRNEYHCALAIAHHMGKRPQGTNVVANRRAGQRLLGSTTLHGWCDSAIYCDQVTEHRPGWVGARMELEFRSMSPRHPLDVRLMWGEPGDPDMKCQVQRWDLTGMILSLVRDEPGITAAKAAEVLEIDKRTVLGRARDSDLIEMAGGRRGRGHSWQLFPSDNGQA